VGDTTAIETKEGLVFLAVLVDLCTRAIVGWALGEANDTELCALALRQALSRGFRKGFVHHTDRGSTYTSQDYRQMVEAAGGRRSMSRGQPHVADRFVQTASSRSGDVLGRSDSSDAQLAAGEISGVVAEVLEPNPWAAR
jgi:hypothetical protein